MRRAVVHSLFAWHCSARQCAALGGPAGTAQQGSATAQPHWSSSGSSGAAATVQRPDAHRPAAVDNEVHSVCRPMGCLGRDTFQLICCWALNGLLLAGQVRQGNRHRSAAVLPAAMQLFWLAGQCMRGHLGPLLCCWQHQALHSCTLGRSAQLQCPAAGNCAGSTNAL